MTRQQFGHWVWVAERLCASPAAYAVLGTKAAAKCVAKHIRRRGCHPHEVKLPSGGWRMMAALDTERVRNTPSAVSAQPCRKNAV